MVDGCTLQDLKAAEAIVKLILDAKVFGCAAGAITHACTPCTHSWPGCAHAASVPVYAAAQHTGRCEARGSREICCIRQFDRLVRSLQRSSTKMARRHCTMQHLRGGLGSHDFCWMLTRLLWRLCRPSMGTRHFLMHW